MDNLKTILNIPHFKEETIKKIESLRNNKISFSLSFSEYLKKNNTTYLGEISPLSKAENYLSINLAKFCSIHFNHEHIISLQNSPFVFDYFKIFEEKPIIINDEIINIKIKFKNILLDYKGTARYPDISQAFLIGRCASDMSKIAQLFLEDSSEKFICEIEIEDPAPIGEALKLHEGQLWENVFFKELKIANLPENSHNIPKATLELLDLYNATKDLSLFYQIKLSLNIK